MGEAALKTKWFPTLNWKGIVERVALGGVVEFLSPEMDELRYCLCYEIFSLFYLTTSEIAFLWFVQDLNSTSTLYLQILAELGSPLYFHSCCKLDLRITVMRRGAVFVALLVSGRGSCSNARSISGTVSTLQNRL